MLHNSSEIQSHPLCDFLSLVVQFHLQRMLYPLHLTNLSWNRCPLLLLIPLVVGTLLPPLWAQDDTCRPTRQQASSTGTSNSWQHLATQLQPLQPTQKSVPRPTFTYPSNACPTSKIYTIYYKTLSALLFTNTQKLFSNLYIMRCFICLCQRKWRSCH